MCRHTPEGSTSAALQCVREDDRWPTSSDGATAERQQIKDSLPLRYAYKQWLRPYHVDVNVTYVKYKGQPLNRQDGLQNKGVVAPFHIVSKQLDSNKPWN